MKPAGNIFERMSVATLGTLLDARADGKVMTTADVTLLVAEGIALLSGAAPQEALTGGANVGAYMTEQGYVTLKENPEPCSAGCPGCNLLVNVTPAGEFVATMSGAWQPPETPNN
jgi:hypothetical protein